MAALMGKYYCTIFFNKHCAVYNIKMSCYYKSQLTIQVILQLLFLRSFIFKPVLYVILGQHCMSENTVES